MQACCSESTCDDLQMSKRLKMHSDIYHGVGTSPSQAGMWSLQALSGCCLCEEKVTGRAEEKSSAEELDSKGKRKGCGLWICKSVLQIHSVFAIDWVVRFTGIGSGTILGTVVWRCVDGWSPGRLCGHAGSKRILIPSSPIGHTIAFVGTSTHYPFTRWNWMASV